jgi:hypothetical protein
VINFHNRKGKCSSLPCHTRCVSALSAEVPGMHGYNAFLMCSSLGVGGPP